MCCGTRQARRQPQYGRQEEAGVGETLNSDEDLMRAATSHPPLISQLTHPPLLPAPLTEPTPLPLPPQANGRRSARNEHEETPRNHGAPPLERPRPPMPPDQPYYSPDHKLVSHQHSPPPRPPPPSDPYFSPRKTPAPVNDLVYFSPRRPPSPLPPAPRLPSRTQIDAPLIDFEMGANSKERASERPRTEVARQVLTQASAPPPEAVVLEAISLDSKEVLGQLARTLSEQGALGTLAAMGATKRSTLAIVNPVLYEAIAISSMDDAEQLLKSLSTNARLGDFVHRITITPLDGTSSATVPDFVGSLAKILCACPHARLVDEDMTLNEWDVVTLETDYPLTPAARTKLCQFTSRRCWWEIGAVHSLLQRQPELTQLVFGGAVMDRDWEGQKILARPVNVLCPAIRSLEVTQIMHEDTLMVLLKSCGPTLESLRIGFQQIGTTDDDTPRASIALALAHVGPHLRHFALKSPTKESDDTTGLLDECVAVLPNLEVLEFTESIDSLPVSIPIASPKLLTLLPPKLRILRARGVVSFSTSKVLVMLDHPNSIPVLDTLDLMWANEEKEGYWKDRHKERIEGACEEYGIRCFIGKGDKELKFTNPL